MLVTISDGSQIDLRVDDIVKVELSTCSTDPFKGDPASVATVQVLLLPNGGDPGVFVCDPGVFVCEVMIPPHNLTMLYWATPGKKVTASVHSIIPKDNSQSSRLAAKYLKKRVY